MTYPLTPPFPIKGEFPTRLYAGEMEIIIHRQDQPTIDPFTDEAFNFDPTIEMMTLFQNAVNAQMFSFDARTPNCAEMILSDQLSSGGTDALVFRYQVKGFNPISGFYLMAMLSQAFYSFDPIGSVEFRPAESSCDVVGCDALWTYSKTLEPEASLPFEIHVDEAAFGGDTFDITLTFVDALSEEQFEKVRFDLLVWDEMRVVGGFLLDLKEQDAHGNSGHIVQLNPKVVKLTTMDFFEGDPSALNCLINYAANINYAGLKLVEFCFE